MPPMLEGGQNLSRTDRRLREGLGDVGLAFFNFPSLSDVQRATIRPIAEGENVLVCAATAAGKTEAIVAPLVWRLRKSQDRTAARPRLLAIAPTRALVADLTARLEAPLGQLGWRCGAQTSDFGGAAAEPDVLVTTPESFDSMLVRRLRVVSGEPVGHLLANVAAIFVDEAHCFDSTARGDQLLFLISRIRKLRESAVTKGWASTDTIQVCAASATIHEPQELANRLLGPRARAIACPGSRPIDVFTTAGTWQRLDDGLPVEDLAPAIPIDASDERLCQILWEALQAGECRKALAFVPSRRQCDLLGKKIRTHLQERRSIWVETHHGSLSREHRQRVERGFHERRDALLVATNTLEVGVDIGDVDVVVLLGAPPDTASLLQRIGRGGRRTGLTRVLPVARNAIDAAALASQLLNAAAGRIEPRHRFRRWDVFPQQVISYIRQNQGQGRPKEALGQLAASVWKAPDTSELAVTQIRLWKDEGCLAEDRRRLHLAGPWEGYAAHGESDYSVHSNIRSAGVGREVRSGLTGELIGTVAEPAEGAQTMTIAGHQHRVDLQDDCIVVIPVGDAAIDAHEDTPQYGGRRRRVSETFAANVRRGCGLNDDSAPIISVEGRLIWYHFGGEVYESLLRGLFPRNLEAPAVAGIALRVRTGFDGGAITAPDFTRLNRLIAEGGLQLLEEEGPARFVQCVAKAGLDAMLSDLRFTERFAAWVKSRNVFVASPPIDQRLAATLLQ